MISISIVEDNNYYRTSLLNLLEAHEQFDVISSFSSAEEAFEELPLNTPDIIIVDIELKGLSGIDLIKVVKPKISRGQFLMCTSYQDNENVFNALKAGASGYIVKGDSFTAIQNAIIELHNGGAPMSPYIARKVISFMQQPEADMNVLSDRELEVNFRKPHDQLKHCKKSPQEYLQEASRSE